MKLIKKFRDTARLIFKFELRDRFQGVRIWRSGNKNKMEKYVGG